MLDINTLAAWGEFIGGIAVVVSLIYLASQIRQNSKLLQVSATVAIATSGRLGASTIMDEPSLGRIWTMETAEFESLPEDEQMALSAFVSLQIVTFYQHYYFRKDGVVRDEVWKAQRRMNASLFRRAWTQKVWSDSRFGFSDEFGEFLDGLIREAEAAE
jgi:hypothetical protein